VKAKSRIKHTGSLWPVHTSRGRFYADWTTEALVARERQLIFFSSFCRREDAQKGFGASVCALTYTGNRGSGVPKLIGTTLLSVPSAYWIYAHMNAVTRDGINLGLLGTDATVRLAMGRMTEEQGGRSAH